ncbi:MAG: Ig-like domain repeat protein [Bryobacteraceae bacterium]
MASSSLCLAQSTDQEARTAWRKSMSRTALPKKGCFQASYPSTEWREVPCKAPPSYPLPGRGGKPKPNTVGGGGTNDISAQVSGLISTAEGTFLRITPGATETGNTYSGASCSVPTATNVANAFTLQLNANTFTTSVCNSGVVGSTPALCRGWQQFVYDNNAQQAYMQYWLENYGTTGTACLAGWGSFPSPSNASEVDCYTNSSIGVGISGALTIADLTQTVLTATADSGGNDTLLLTTPDGNLNAVGAASLLNLSQSWQDAEFNIFGDGCGSEANFGGGSTVVVKTSVDSGTSTAAPSCLSASFTGETNNLTLVSPCCPYGGASPNVQFMETNAGHTATCGSAGLVGDPHITTTDGTHYDFQGAGEFVSLRDAGGLEIQTRQTPISTNFFPNPDAHDGLATCVSINTAVAARVGEHRVTWEPNLNGVPDPGGLQLRIDGALTAVGPQGMALGSGGRVVPAAGGALEVDFPDGKTLLVTPEWWTSQSKWFLDVNVLNLGLVSADSADTGRGIAGAIAAGSWLPSLPDGTSMGPMPASLQDRYIALYKKFADAWRVSDRDSLFDYAPGTSTNTFTMRDWPSEEPPCVAPNSKAERPVSAGAAEEACRQVTDKNTHADCIFDVRATGNLGFATAYVAAQRVQNDSTTTTLADDPDPSQVGESVTFTAFVRPSSSTATGAPAGSIQFAVDRADAGKPVPLDSKGRATWETSRLKVGTHQVTASYMPGPHSVFLASTSPEKLHVVQRCPCGAAAKP